MLNFFRVERTKTLKRILNKIFIPFLLVSISSCAILSGHKSDSFATVPDDNGVTLLDGSAPSSNDITSFYISGAAVTINGTSISVVLPFGTDLENNPLAPIITLSEGASISPAIGVEQDFSSPVVYTVTAADNTIKKYTVGVSVASNSDKNILAFSILGRAAEIDGQDISVTLPYGTDVTALVPNIVYTGSGISPADDAEQSFIEPVIYTVTAPDLTTKNYTVTVNIAATEDKDILAFSTSDYAGTINGTNIKVTLPYGTSVTSLTPKIVHSGTNISPETGIANNFTTPKTYTVTAQDGTTKDYTVTVVVLPNSAKEITSFSIYGVYGSIVGTNISIAVPYDTPSLTALVPNIVHTGASMSPASGVAQDFTNPVQYTVTAADLSTKTYTVTATTALSPAKDISSFNITNSAVTINNTLKTIAVTMQAGTNVTALIPTITITGSSISPTSGVAQDFTNPVTYIVTAEDSSIKEYTVTVTLATVYVLGQTGPAGGLIFYDKGSYSGSPSWRYLEAAPASTGQNILWSNIANVAVVGTSTAIGTGQANTTAIITQIGNTNGAARFCDNLVEGGYSDWFLPSRDEMTQVRVILYGSGIGGFGANYYWSSSESAASTAYSLYFGNTYVASYTKSTSTYMRCIRAF